MDTTRVMQGGAVAIVVAAFFAGVRLAPPIAEAASVETAADTELPTPVIRNVAPVDPRQRALASHLAKRYRLAMEPTEHLVEVAHNAARQVGLDPLLLLAVMAIESGFNPIAESVMGAKGLMQVIPKFHKQVVARHGGEQAMLDPDVNIMIGAHILRDYIDRTGNIEAGLQFYNGSLRDESSQYSEKVIAERDRLRQVVQQVRQSPASQRI
jgi:soluble lytic murein transglycosylase-like protein